MAKAKTINRRRMNNYTLHDKVEVVKMVHLGSTISLVSRETGIRRASIHEWCKDPEIIELVTRELPEAIANEVETAIVTKGLGYIETVYAVKEKALKRMEVLIGTCKSLKEVTNAFAVLSGLQEGDDPSVKKGVVNNIHNTLVQRIINLHNSKNDGKGTIEANGDTEEQEE